jgi:hypothetical protein
MAIYSPILPTHEWHQFDRMPFVYTISNVVVTGHELVWRLFNATSNETLLEKSVGAGITINSGSSVTVVVLETDYDDLPANVYEYELYDETIHRVLSYGPAHLLKGRDPEGS